MAKNEHEAGWFYMGNIKPYFEVIILLWVSYLTIILWNQGE